MNTDQLKRVLADIQYFQKFRADSVLNAAIASLNELIEARPAVQGEPVTVLPDGSAFAVMSWPLPKDHWLYAERQYKDGADEPVELGKPILTHELRDAVVSAVRYAIRWATNCGKEIDFDPDALVQNAVYAICGPYGQAYTTPQPAVHGEPVNKYCCHTCFNKSGQAFLDRMILCPECGNKRCPKATHHELPCTNSNEPGQAGSIYTTPQPAVPERKPLTDEEIEDEWERITGHSIFGGDRSEGRPMYVSPDEVTEFTRAIEAAHGIKGDA